MNIIELIKRGNAKEIENYILDNPHAINYQDINGNTPLHLALKEASATDSILPPFYLRTLLVHKNCMFYIQNNDQDTAIDILLKGRSIGFRFVLNVLIDHGFCLTQKDQNDNSSLLEKAIKYNQTKKINIILEKILFISKSLRQPINLIDYCNIEFPDNINKKILDQLKAIKDHTIKTPRLLEDPRGEYPQDPMRDYHSKKRKTSKEGNKKSKLPKTSPEDFPLDLSNAPSYMDFRLDLPKLTLMGDTEYDFLFNEMVSLPGFEPGTP